MAKGFPVPEEPQQVPEPTGGRGGGAYNRGFSKSTMERLKTDTSQKNINDQKAHGRALSVTGH